MDLLGADDDEIERHYTPLGFDGTWSLTTKLSILALNGYGLPLYLNYPWAITPQTFRCPICARAKPQLMERTKNKIIAHLSIDHDHIIDFINLQAKRLALQGDFRRIYNIYMSFMPTIVCNTCNTIDSIIKAKSQHIDEFFTFSPSHKAQLFKPYRRSKHWINIKKSHHLWQQSKEEFQAKKQAINTALHDYIGETQGTFHYKRYIGDVVKHHFYQQSPSCGPHSFYHFLKRSMANGVVVLF